MRVATRRTHHWEDIQMRISSVAVIAAGLAFAVTGCTTNANGTGGPSASAPATGSAATSAAVASGTAPACVVGSWKGTGMSRSGSVAGATITASGGGGFTVTISGDGKTTVDFGGMQPIDFTSMIGGTNIKGTYTHGGKVTGTVRATPTSDTKGTWEPVGTVDWSTLTITVDLTSPM